MFAQFFRFSFFYIMVTKIFCSRNSNKNIVSFPTMKLKYIGIIIEEGGKIKRTKMRL
jgi:hypothetical protein